MTATVEIPLSWMYVVKEGRKILISLYDTLGWSLFSSIQNRESSSASKTPFKEPSQDMSYELLLFMRRY
jgi:hypothetical protein